MSKRGVKMSMGAQTDIDAVLQLRNGLEQLLQGAPVEPVIDDYDRMLTVGFYRSRGSIWLKGTAWPRNCYVMNDTRNFGSPEDAFAFAITPEELSRAIDELSVMVRYIEQWKKRRRELSKP